MEREREKGGGKREAAVTRVHGRLVARSIIDRRYDDSQGNCRRDNVFCPKT